MIKTCFINRERMCTSACVAYLEDPRAGTACRLINTFERLIPPPTRPTAPTPPVKVKP